MQIQFDSCPRKHWHTGMERVLNREPIGQPTVALTKLLTGLDVMHLNCAKLW